MTEIKFRCIHPHTKEIMDVCCIDWMHDEVYFEQGTDVAYPINQCQLMQFTGLRDKNGVEIYEGDVVRKTGDKFCKGGAITMHHGCWMVMRDDNNYFNLHFYLNEVDAIGNIHQHQHLLESAQ